MNRIKLVVLIVALYCFGESKAQITHNLRLDPTAINALPDTLPLGFADTLNISIFNDSATTFNTQVNIFYTINGGVLNNADSIGAIYYPSSFTNESILPHDSIMRQLIIHVTTPYFIVGSSAVVIWPVAAGFSASTYISDSVAKTLFITPATGINQPEEKDLKVYVSGQHLVIQENDQYLLKNVKLYDVAGALLYQQELTISGAINMAPFAPGIYFAEINYADNTRRVVRVFSGK